MSTIEIKKDDEIVVNFHGANYLWFIHYIDGCFLGVQNLLQQLNRENATIVYPTLMCLAQYMELWIKLLFLALNDSNNVKELGLGSHDSGMLVDKLCKRENLLKEYGISVKELRYVKEKFEYFETFAVAGEVLSVASRFPIDIKTPKLIIDFDKIGAARDDNFTEFNSKALEVLQATNHITKMFFEKYLEKKLTGSIDVL